MATVIEIDSIERLFEIVAKAHKSVVEAGAKRIITELKIDDRKDKNASIQKKLNSLKNGN